MDGEGADAPANETLHTKNLALKHKPSTMLSSKTAYLQLTEALIPSDSQKLSKKGQLAHQTSWNIFVSRLFNMFLNLDVHIKMDIRVLFPQSHRSILHRSQIYSIQICEKETAWGWERRCLQALLCCPDAVCIIPAGSRWAWTGLQLPAAATTDIPHEASAPRKTWGIKNQFTISRAGDRPLPHTLSDLLFCKPRGGDINRAPC